MNMQEMYEASLTKVGLKDEAAALQTERASGTAKTQTPGNELESVVADAVAEHEGDPVKHEAATIMGELAVKYINKDQTPEEMLTAIPMMVEEFLNRQEVAAIVPSLRLKLLSDLPNAIKTTAADTDAEILKQATNVAGHVALGLTETISTGGTDHPDEFAFLHGLIGVQVLQNALGHMSEGRHSLTIDAVLNALPELAPLAAHEYVSDMPEEAFESYLQHLETMPVDNGLHVYLNNRLERMRLALEANTPVEPQPVNNPQIRNTNQGGDNNS